MSPEHCHLRPEELSIRLHEAIAAKLESDPVSTIAVAGKNIARWREIHKGTGVIYYLDRWERLLDGPLEQLKAFLVSPSQEARDMRQCTPFAGVLSHKERFGIIRSFSEEWERRRVHAPG